jgi:uncharacterized protein DUF1524
MKSAIAAAILLVGLAACSPVSPTPSASSSPSASNGLPAGEAIRVDGGVEISADSRTVNLRFVGGEVLPATDPCHTDYAGWARPAGEVLKVAVVLLPVAPPPGQTSPFGCSAVGFGRSVQVTLQEPFLGETAKDISFGTLIPIGRPGSASASAASSPPTPTPSQAAASAGGNLTLSELLALLRVAPEQRLGYDRDLFPTWADADGDGCNTRREVLIAESLTPVTVGSNCSISGGTWRSLYDGLTFNDIADVSIDHVVALAEAWDSGASAWTPQRREQFANDLGVPWTLIAVSTRSNDEKSDLDPADWLPPNDADRCSFVGDWLAIKVRWSLAVDQREHDALASLAADCPSTTRPVVLATAAGQGLGGFATPQASTAGNCDPAYPSVCIPPPPPDLDCADITFRRFTVLPPDPHHFDGDGDGIGCEG